jgi:hypothetical protein
MTEEQKRIAELERALSDDVRRLDFLGKNMAALDSKDDDVRTESWARGDVAEIAFDRASKEGKTPAEAVRIALDAAMAHTPEAPK